MACQEVAKGSRVFLTEHSGPRQLMHSGRRLFRFMDSIYLDRPSEKLDRESIQILNEVRRPLLDRSEVAGVNARVRQALAAGAQAVAARSVLEWGCGYHPMHELLGDVDYAAVDIDPGVVAHARGLGIGPVHLADRDLGDIAPADVIVSPFVFHFRIPRRHIATMRRVVGPAGFVLANVYRRSPRARRELENAFRDAGLLLERRRDPAQLCVEHEFWCLYAPDRAGTNQARAREALEAVTAATDL
ncbi:hypothetical protein Asi02nite_78460 [Asanoa siamensis]|uniref:Class I SAM-dependent methyltransferase n=1 Tax=Asanoa siamensis TaxID=926357 RepID=A0ABQ4D462_9ACTN|nr:hypothetical protein Asi02nite_78460 [Asanoa siamensis]